MQLERSDEIIRLKGGLYVVNPETSGSILSIVLIANHLCSPSYVSKQTALRHFGLIPEAVYSVQSMTIKSSVTYENRLGRFDYTHISREAFSVGLKQYTDNGVVSVVASPEKALCDLIAGTPDLKLRYLKETQQYLEEDLRLDMDAFRTMDSAIFEEYAGVGKKANSVRIIIKLLRR